MNGAVRSAVDKCPGVVRPFTSADGLIVRLRTGGQPVAVGTLARLSGLARRFGDGNLQLTSRGALQLRALPDPLPEDLRAGFTGSGLIPSASHELVRNIVSSPLTGLDADGRADLRSIAADLDRRLCETPELAGLPGRFLFVLDDGRGDVLGEAFDLAYQAASPERGTVFAGSTDLGWDVGQADAVSALLTLASEFLRARDQLDPTPWRVAELPAPLAAPTVSTGPAPRAVGTGLVAPAAQHPLGAVPCAFADAAVVGAPLGLLSPAQVEVIAAAAVSVGVTEVIVTPWRSVVIPGAGGRLDELADAGLVTGDMSPWARMGACTGRPGCERALVDTHAIARGLVERIDPVGPPVFVSGCDRRCGCPSGDVIDLVAPADVTEALALMRAEAS